MANSIFLKLDGIAGESKDANHKEWIHISRFSWGVKQPGNMHQGGGGGAGRATVEDLEVVANIDKSAPAILHYCSAGKHIAHAYLSICKAGGNQMEYVSIKLEDIKNEKDIINNIDIITFNTISLFTC